MSASSTALQDAVALLTAAMDASGDDLAALVAELREEGDPDLLHAVIALCRSLCLATARLIHVVDDSLTDDEALLLSDDDLLPMAMQVVRRYASAAALEAERRDA
jgi:hypothetical protein